MSVGFPMNSCRHCHQPYEILVPAAPLTFSHLVPADAIAAVGELAADRRLVVHCEIERDGEGRVVRVLVLRLGRVLGPEDGIKSTKTDPTGTADAMPRAPTMPKGQE